MISPTTVAILTYLAIFWGLPWKGYALWKAASGKQVAWYVAIFLINTLAILEIVYLVFFQKEPWCKCCKRKRAKFAIKISKKKRK